MRCLVASDDAATRDAIASAVKSFPEIDVDKASVDDARLMIRRRRFDFGFLTLKSGSRESLTLWDEMRTLASECTRVALTPRSGMSSARAAEITEFRPFARIGTPIDSVEVYGTVRRLLDRLKKVLPLVTAPSPAPR